jgi:hypothetical protein
MAVPHISRDKLISKQHSAEYTAGGTPSMSLQWYKRNA